MTEYLPNGNVSSHTEGTTPMTKTDRIRLIEMAQEALARAKAKRDAQADARLRDFFQTFVDSAQRTLDAQEAASTHRPGWALAEALKEPAGERKF